MRRFQGPAVSPKRTHYHLALLGSHHSAILKSKLQRQMIIPLLIRFRTKWLRRRSSDSPSFMLLTRLLDKTAFGEAVRRSLETCGAGRAHPYRR